MRSSRSRANRKARKNNHSSSPATQQQGSENLTSTTRRSFQRCRFFGIGGALILAIGLATAIASPAQTFNVLASFDVTDGAYTVTGLTQGRDGNLYRTTTRGGANNSGCYYTPDCGTIIKITPGGKLTTLYNFCSQANCADGGNPEAGLVNAIDGNFYGTTNTGGTNNSSCEFGEAFGCGTIFKITPNGTLTTLHSFCTPTGCPDGGNPRAGLVQAASGDLYGTTEWVGANGEGGTVFKITPTGKLTTLYTFCSRANCTDGAGPEAPLMQADDGNFYGTTSGGGANGVGTVFKLTPAGKLTTLYSFCSQTDCSDGKYPAPAPLVQATDGDLYGATSFGGASCSGDYRGCGTVFKITVGGELTTLYSFCTQTNCPDGTNPIGGVVRGTDGNFYGTALSGGANQYCGTLFKITPEGTLTTLHSFDGDDGTGPYAGLIQATNGNFYGTTFSGGGGGGGTVFGLSVGLGPFVTFVRDSGKVDWTAEILGQGFTGTTGVSFNGTAAAGFTVKRDTYLTAIVPDGATTGSLTVTTPGGVLTSNVPYRVQPTILSFSPTSGPVGTPVTITGVSLTQTEKVNFAGVHASFTVNSDTQVTATVPTGAQTGKIAIVTAGGKTWSAQEFTVTQ